MTPTRLTICIGIRDPNMNKRRLALSCFANIIGLLAALLILGGIITINVTKGWVLGLGLLFMGLAYLPYPETMPLGIPASTIPGARFFSRVLLISGLVVLLASGLYYLSQP